MYSYLKPHVAKTILTFLIKVINAVNLVKLVEVEPLSDIRNFPNIIFAMLLQKFMYR